MNRLIHRLVLCALFLVAFVAAGSAADPIGKVVAVVGSPSVSGPTGSRSLSANSAVFENDKIVVGNSGNAQIILNDGTKLVVGAGSSLVLDKFVMQGSSGQAESVGVKALRGTFRFITGKSKKSAYNIATSNATIGIRGTGFDFWVKSNTGVLVTVGIVELNNNLGKSVLVRAGCEMGRTSPTDARRLTGQSFGEAVKNNLPFILNQKSLKPIFRLPVENCQTKLSNSTGLTGKGSEDGGDNGNSNEGRNRNNNGQTPGGNRGSPGTVGGGTNCNNTIC